MGALSGLLGKAVKVSNNGKNQGYIGTKYRKNGVMELDYLPNPNPTADNDGHFVLKIDGKIVDNVLDNNGLCLYNALVAGLSEQEKQERGISSGEDLYHKMEAHRAAHPEYALQSTIHYQALLRHNPDALMRGAGVWADAATGLQDIETWLNAHPLLLDLIKNTGSVVGGALWLKNLTPVGILTGLVVNYGYEQLLKLMDGNIEVAKEHLTTYFLGHDEDITPEQASYLANCAMKVLQTAGQIAVHQVAAKGFNKVRRGVGRKTSKAKQPRGVHDSKKTLQQVLPSEDAFLKSAEATWKDGAQGTLNVAGRALQKHAGRTGSPFGNIKFSGKTANQDAMKVIKQIIDAPNKRIAPQENGTTIIYDMATGRGFGISRKGLFNGFRNMK